jgi:Ca2+-binding RTX toxin-like protein
VTINAGDTISAAIVIDVQGDAVLEPDESFEVVVGNPTPAGVLVDQTPAIGWIRNDDFGGPPPPPPPPVLSIFAVDASKAEGTGTSTPFTFRIERSANLQGDVTVSWEVDFPNSVADGFDFLGPTSDTVTLPDGVSSVPVTIDINADSDFEPDEGFAVRLTGQSAGAIGTQSATGTIVNDDLPPPTLSIVAVDASKTEESAAAGTVLSTPFTFSIERSGNLQGDVAVTWEVDFPNSAADSVDFSGPTSGTVTLPDGFGSLAVTIYVNADSDFEPDELFIVKLDSASGATILVGSAFGTIINDDPQFSIGGVVSRAEGGTQQNQNPGPTAFKFPIKMTGYLPTPGGPTTFQLGAAAFGSGANPADGLDFNGTPAGPLTYDVNDPSTHFVVVSVRPDRDEERNDRFTVRLIGSNVDPNNREATGVIVNDDIPVPAWPPPVFRGDPHLITGDGLAYDFQAAGEFVLLRGTADPDLQLQVRTRAVSDALSSTTAIATLIDGHRVTIDALDADPVRVDGAVQSIPADNSEIAVGSGSIRFNGSAYTLVDPGRLTLFVETFSDRLDIALGVDPSLNGALEGLLGDFDGDPSNDLALADGTLLAQPVPFATLYGAFADDWRVTDQTSLFDYRAGESTATFTDRSFPRQVVTLADLPPALVARATELVDQAGITDPVMREATILDFAVTGDLSYLSAAGIQFTPAATATIIDAPPPLPTLSVVAVEERLPEGDAGITQFRFDVYRIGSTVGEVPLTWQVTPGGEKPAGADDFGGLLPFGVITLDDGEAVASFVVSVTGDPTFENDETFAVEIAVDPGVQGSMLVVVPRAFATIANDDVPPNVPPVTQPDVYTLARGRVSTVAAAFGVGANDSDPDGDPLSYALLTGSAHGSVAVNADGGFTFTADNDFVGADSFTYRATDAGGLFADAIVSIMVEERAETIHGTGQADVIFGYGLDDRLFGLGGHDIVDGGVGDDDLNGEAGDDVIEGAEGDDVIRGGAGDDVLHGGDGRDKVQGGDGDDMIEGAEGDDVLLGQAGHDIILGGVGNDFIDGGDGDDVLEGGAGNDVIHGGAGNDLIIGGSGLDWMFGGAGTDRFVLADRQAERDWIKDFQPGEDLLEIEAALFGAGLAPGALDPARLVVGASPVATQPGLGQFLYSTATGVLRWDADGSGSGWPPVIATLTGVASLSASDFIIV